MIGKKFITCRCVAARHAALLRDVAAAGWDASSRGPGVRRENSQLGRIENPFADVPDTEDFWGVLGVFFCSHSDHDRRVPVRRTTRNTGS